MDYFSNYFVATDGVFRSPK